MKRLWLWFTRRQSVRARLAQKRFAVAALEFTGVVVTSVGIGCELMQGGDVYLVVITAGSCLIAVGGMLWTKVKF